MKKWMSNLKISKKMSFGFLFMIILSILIGGIGHFQLKNTGAKSKEHIQAVHDGIMFSSQMSQ